MCVSCWLPRMAQTIWKCMIIYYIKSIRLILITFSFELHSKEWHKTNITRCKWCNAVSNTYHKSNIQSNVRTFLLNKDVLRLVLSLLQDIFQNLLKRNSIFKWNLREFPHWPDCQQNIEEPKRRRIYHE